MGKNKDSSFFSNLTPDGDTELLPEGFLDEIDQAIGGEAFQSLTPPPANSTTPSPTTEHTFEAWTDDSISFELDETVPAIHNADFGIGEMQQILMDMMSQTLAPLSRYIKAFRAGEDYERTLELCDLLVSPMIPQLEKAMVTQPMEDLAFFKSVLLFAKNELDPQGRAVMKNVVYRAYQEVKRTFCIGFRGSRKAVRNIIEFLARLQANDTISEQDIVKFFAIGVPSLTWIRRTNSKELSSLSGLSVEKIRTIRALAKKSKASGMAIVHQPTIKAPIPTNTANSEAPLTSISPQEDTNPFVIDLRPVQVQKD
jgi:hypothetical protein